MAAMLTGCVGVGVLVFAWLGKVPKHATEPLGVRLLGYSNSVGGATFALLELTNRYHLRIEWGYGPQSIEFRGEDRRWHRAPSMEETGLTEMGPAQSFKRWVQIPPEARTTAWRIRVICLRSPTRLESIGRGVMALVSFRRPVGGRWQHVPLPSSEFPAAWPSGRWFTPS